MARSRTISERLYLPGSYGPFSVDSFTSANTERLELRLTQVNWPEGVPLMRIQIAWDSGDAATFEVAGVTPDIETGEPLSQVNFWFTVPRTSSGKRNVAGGSVSVELYQLLRTAITVTAV